MVVETQILYSLLKLTRTSAVSRRSLAKAAKVSGPIIDNVVLKLAQADLISEYQDLIEASPTQRVKIAVAALSSAADFERVCALLSWAEFEGIVAQAFEANGYRTLRNFRFKQQSKRWEIDVLGVKKPFIICVDCKHWKRGWRRSAIAKAVEAQTQRTKALSRVLPAYRQKAKLEQVENTRLIPVVMSLTPGPFKFYAGVPIVPVLQVQDFINELPMQGHLLRSFSQNATEPKWNLLDFS